MGESRTVSWTDLVNTAPIGCKIQELAGLISIHPLSFLVLIQPFFFEYGSTHTEVSSNTPDILKGKSRRHVAATVGTGKAISFRPDFFIYLFYIDIKLLRWVYLQLC
jgi:hypothetical protein